MTIVGPKYFHGALVPLQFCVPPITLDLNPQNQRSRERVFFTEHWSSRRSRVRIFLIIKSPASRTVPSMQRVPKSSEWLNEQERAALTFCSRPVWPFDNPRLTSALITHSALKKHMTRFSKQRPASYWRRRKEDVQEERGNAETMCGDNRNNEGWQKSHLTNVASPTPTHCFWRENHWQSRKTVADSKRFCHSGNSSPF